MDNKPIPRFKEGQSNPSSFSADDMNKIVDTVNALKFMKGVGGIKIYPADAGYIVYGGLSGSLNSTSGSTITNVSSSITQVNYYQCMSRYG